MHSLKVGQLAGAIAAIVERKAHRSDQAELLDEFGGLHRYAAEAGALAHDLGHPPFGHVGERTLRTSVDQACDDLGIANSDGYEGNAQAFRIVAVLSRHKASSRAGLNLTAGTLNAMQKYPWQRSVQDAKYGCYDSEVSVLSNTRSYLGHLGRRRTLEAEIVDIADDITYAVHDVEDFFRAGLIPLTDLRRLGHDSGTREDLIARAATEWRQTLAIHSWMCGETDVINPDAVVPPGPEVFDAAWRETVEFCPIVDPYEGSSEQRGAIRDYTATLIGDLLREVALDERFGVALTDQGLAKVLTFKQLTRKYVVEDPRLVYQQRGQQDVVALLFDFFLTELESKRARSFPPPFRDEAEEVLRDGHDAIERVRLVADTIAAFTEERAFELFWTLSGVAPGTLFERRVV